ncbi:MAG: LysE family translocator [Janthinobacterium lividum]
MTDPFVFAVTVLVLLAVPGPTNSLVATSGAVAGVRRSLKLVPVEVAGYLIAVTALGLLLRPIMASFPGLAMILRGVVGIYLLVLAVKLWRQGQRSMIHETDAAAAGAIGITQVFVTTLLNPKAIVFALGIIPFGSHLLPAYLAGFAVLIAVVATAWIVTGATLGRAAHRRGRGHVVPRVGAATIGAFAIVMMLGPIVARMTR